MAALMPWIDALGWTLLHFLWQGVLIGGAWGAARSLLAREACTARYRVGLAALALLALAPIVTLALLWPAGAPGADPLAVADAATPVLAAAAGFDAAAAVDALLPWFVASWLAGVCLFGARALREWLRLDRIVRHEAQADARIDALLAAVKRRFAFAHRVRVLVSQRIDTPMLIGWLRPVIVLPVAVALGFPRRQVELILAHEIGHLRRGDHLVNLLQTVLETVLFYHPVVHWISREVRNERELCCDRLVLHTMAGESRAYARTLAALEELRLATPMMLAANGGELLERVQRIVGETPRATVEGRASGRWLLLFAGLLAAWTLVPRPPGETLVPAAPGADWHALELAPLAPAIAIAPAALARWQAPRVAASVPAVTPAAVVAAPVAADMMTPAAPAPAPVVAPRVALPSLAATPPETAAPAAVPRVATPAAAPRPLHTVAPAYPGSVVAARVSVEASFTIAADGSVHDIRAQGRADRSFKRAVELALRQWRFAPASADAARRYTQTFVFAPAADVLVTDGCQRQTGSMICRGVAGETVEPTDAGDAP